MKARHVRRLYWLLLRLFPGRARERHGEEMERLVLEMRAEIADAGPVARSSFWIGLTWDVVAGAAAAWIDAGRRRLAGHVNGTSEGGTAVESTTTDVRYALRRMARAPGPSFLVVFLIAVGIAGNAAIFRIFNGLFLQPLAFEESERLVDLNETAPAWDLEYLMIRYRDYAAWRDANTTFESMAVIDDGGGNLMVDGGPRRVGFLRGTHTLDDVLRIEPAAGRFFGPDSDRPGGPVHAVLTHDFWTEAFAGDRTVVGRSVVIDDRTVEIVGVLPPEADAVRDVDLWMPLQQDGTESVGWGLDGIGRLAPGVTVEQARDELTAIHKGMVDEFPVNEVSFPVVQSLQDRYLGDVRLGSGFLLGAVLVVLLLACANVAGLMTARSLTRRREIAVRRAVGATGARIVRQLFTESVVLAVAGALVGAGLGVWISGVLVEAVTPHVPSWVRFDLDGRFVAFAVAITVASAVLFGIWPALDASRREETLGLSLGATASTGRRRTLRLLVLGEVALAVALLVVGGLTVLDIQRLQESDPGFRPDGLVTYRVAPPPSRYATDDERLAFVDRYLARLRAIPGVEEATVASVLPLGGHWGFFLQVEDAPPRDEDEGSPVVLNRIVAPGYFRAMGMELAAGRTFDRSDRSPGEEVVIVNETFVRTHLSHRDDPVGARLTPGTDAPTPDATWMTVVGVVRDVKHYGLDEPMRPGIYRPVGQDPVAGFSVALRATGPTEPVISAARAATREIEPSLPLYQIAEMSTTIDDALWARKATSWLIGSFSAIALLLAAAGLYGVVSYSVSQRTREIGIRMAMGAARGQVMRAVIREGMAPVVAGIALGLAIAFAGAGAISGILVGVRPTNIAVYAGVAFLLLLVTAAANYLPARRAARIDPVPALRE